MFKKKNIKKQFGLSVVFFASCLLFSSFLGFTKFKLVNFSITSIAQAEDSNAEDEEIKEEKKEKEEKIEKIEKKLKKAEKEKDAVVKTKLSVSNQLGAIKGNIKTIENEIAKAENELERIDLEMKKNEEQVNEKKISVAETIRKINQANLEINLIIFEEEEGLGHYFSLMDGMNVLEEELSKKIEKLRLDKESLDKKRIDHEEIQEIKSDQKQTLKEEKAKKVLVLGQTQAELDKKVATVGQLQAKLSKVKSDLNVLLGKNYNAKDIEDAAKFASKRTGVRKDFIMGMLVVESDLGRYTGGCIYKESRMNSHRKTIFKQICKSLDYNYKKKKVSCPPRGYKGTGGAMGVAQFMSDTWMGYQSQIASKTGHNPPDPWSLTDGVMAMALKLGRDGATKKSGECQAAKRYLGGSHQWYCDKVLYWANHYENKL